MHRLSRKFQLIPPSRYLRLCEYIPRNQKGRQAALPGLRTAKMQTEWVAVRLSRWCGLLEVTSDSYSDASPIFSDPDPFVVRFKTKPLVMLGPEHSIPIEDDKLWPRLITKLAVRFALPA